MAFAIDCHDREVLAWTASPRPLNGGDVRTLMDKTLWARFGETVSVAPHAMQWLSDNGPQYTATASVLYAHELGLVPITTPAYSPESNGLAEAFVHSFKRDYVNVHELRDAESVLAQLGGWIDDYNREAPHSNSRPHLSISSYRHRDNQRLGSPTRGWGEPAHHWRSEPQEQKPLAPGMAAPPSPTGLEGPAFTTDIEALLSPLIDVAAIGVTLFGVPLTLIDPPAYHLVDFSKDIVHRSFTLGGFENFTGSSFHLSTSQTEAVAEPPALLLLALGLAAVGAQARWKKLTPAAQRGAA